MTFRQHLLYWYRYGRQQARGSHIQFCSVLLWYGLRLISPIFAKMISLARRESYCPSASETSSNDIVYSLAPGEFEWNFRHVIFKQILVIGGWGISCELALIWMSLDFTDDQSTLVQVMAWCRQATSHYLSQCWPSSLASYGVTRPQWVIK